MDVLFQPVATRGTTTKITMAEKHFFKTAIVKQAVKMCLGRLQQQTQLITNPSIVLF